MGDEIRWVPTDHMLFDCLTKSMNPSLMMKYMNDYVYSFKYDNVISDTIGIPAGRCSPVYAEEYLWVKLLLQYHLRLVSFCQRQW